MSLENGICTYKVNYFASRYVMRYSLIRRKSKYKAMKQQIFQNKNIGLNEISQKDQAVSASSKSSFQKTWLRFEMVKKH